MDATLVFGLVFIGGLLWLLIAVIRRGVAGHGNRKAARAAVDPATRGKQAETCYWLCVVCGVVALFFPGTLRLALSLAAVVAGICAWSLGSGGRLVLGLVITGNALSLLFVGWFFWG